MFTEQQQLDHRRYEAAWLKPFTDNIPEWDSLRFTQRFLAREGKQYVLWSLDPYLRPVLLDRITINGLHVNRSGPNMMLASAFGNAMSIGPAPQRVLDHPVFLWIPALFDARFAPFRYEGSDPLRREMTWRFCVKIASNPAMEAHRRPDQVYFTELGEFRKLWPTSLFQE